MATFLGAHWILNAKYPRKLKNLNYLANSHVIRFSKHNIKQTVAFSLHFDKFAIIKTNK